MFRRQNTKLVFRILCKSQMKMFGKKVYSGFFEFVSQNNWKTKNLEFLLNLVLRILGNLLFGKSSIQNLSQCF